MNHYCSCSLFVTATVPHDMLNTRVEKMNFSASHLSSRCSKLDISSKIVLSNLALAAYSMGPPLFILIFYKRFPFGYWKQLIYGKLLIAWAVITFSFFTGALASLESVEMTSDSLKTSILDSVTLWVFAYPALVMSIGANFVTQFFLSWDEG